MLPEVSAVASNTPSDGAVVYSDGGGDAVERCPEVLAVLSCGTYYLVPSKTCRLWLTRLTMPLRSRCARLRHTRLRGNSTPVRTTLFATFTTASCDGISTTGSRSMSIWAATI